MAGTSREVHEITTEETRNVAVDFSGLLDVGELLSGTPTVTGDGDVTIASAQVNSSALTINNRQVPIGMAVQFRLSEVTRGPHSIEIKCSTDGSQVLEHVIQVQGIRTLY